MQGHDTHDDAGDPRDDSRLLVEDAIELMHTDIGQWNEQGF